MCVCTVLYLYLFYISVYPSGSYHSHTNDPFRSHTNHLHSHINHPYYLSHTYHLVSLLHQLSPHTLNTNHILSLSHQSPLPLSHPSTTLPLTPWHLPSHPSTPLKPHHQSLSIPILLSYQSPPLTLAPITSLTLTPITSSPSHTLALTITPKHPAKTPPSVTQHTDIAIDHHETKHRLRTQ